MLSFLKLYSYVTDEYKVPKTSKWSANKIFRDVRSVVRDKDIKGIVKSYGEWTILRNSCLANVG